MKFNTKTIHGGQKHEEATGAVMPPVFFTSTYAQSSPGEHKGYEYSRGANPTRTALENSFASIEGGSHGFAFSSGLSAIDCVLRLLNPGDEVVAGDDLYGGTYRMFTRLFKKYGLEFSFVDMNSVSNVTDKITEKTKLVWLETPTNPLMKIADIEAISAAVKEINSEILIAVDNTFATPYIQQPLNVGADIVMHSATKYIGGHSDVIAGAVLGRAELMQRIKVMRTFLGNQTSPNTGWLLMRSLETLKIRMDKQAENAKYIAEFLASHPKVEKVYWPGFEDHPNHDIAKSQMSDFGGMLSFTLKGNKYEDAIKILENLKVFTLAESLGGVESLSGHPASMTHASIPKEEREKTGVTDSLIRLSVGIEAEKDLIDDLESVLKMV